MSPSALPRYLQIAQALESQFPDRERGGQKLPGVRQIAADEGVSIVTASRALQVLRDKGLIRTVDRSGCYWTPGSRKPKERWGLFMRLTPEPWQQATGSITMKGFQAVARRRGFTITTDAVSFSEGMTEKDWKRQVRTALADGLSGLVFLPSRRDEEQSRQDERFLKVCRREHLPVVLLDRNLRGHFRPLEYDLVSVDDVQAGLQVTRHLVDRGRRRIAFVAGSPTSSHDRRVAGYLLALHLCGETRNGSGNSYAPIVLQQPAELQAQVAFRQLADELLRVKADAAVCYEDYVAVAIIMELLSRKVRVPKDIAVAGFDNLPIGTTFSIGVTTYDYPAVTVADQAIHLLHQRIRNILRPPIHILIPGRLVLRESTGSA